MTLLRLMLADYLVKNHILCTKDEAEVLAEIVLELDNDDDDNDNDDIENADIIFSKKDIIIENLVEHLDIEEDQAINIVLNLQRQHKLLSSDSSSICSDEDFQEVNSDEDTEESSIIEDNHNDNIGEEEEEDNGSEYYLIDGECELCDRGDIKLTKHHLIPKSTWSKIRTKLLNAADAKERGDTNKALLIVGSGLEDILDRIVVSSENDKFTIRTILHETTCDICRQCHTTVHRTHANMDLALYFNTVEKLLDDTQISKFCKWNSKQKTGKYRR
ncbi:MAG: hypothetical protein ACI8RD_007946 [Bacillariaceae sp.]|jgi:hypothetical protein